MLIKYKQLFKEAFLKSDIEKALRLTCSILEKRLGDKIFISPIATDFEKIEKSSIRGVHYTTASRKQLRFNWKMSDSSGLIQSIDVWYTKKYNPDITIDFDELNIVKIIDAIVEAITKKTPNSYITLAEDIAPRGGKIISKEIANAIYEWVKDMEYDDTKLANTRMSYLHRDYEFWRTQVTKSNFKTISLPTFTSYMLQLFQMNNIQNVFVKKITVRKAMGNTKIVDSNTQEKFNAATASDNKRTIVWYDTKHQDNDKVEKNKPIIEDFKSCIIITNKPKKKISPAIISRTAPIEINVDIPEIIDNIRVNIDVIMTNFLEATREVKLEVLDFIEDTLKGNIQQLDYRLFERCVIYRLDGNLSLKKFCLPILRTA